MPPSLRDHFGLNQELDGFAPAPDKQPQLYVEQSEELKNLTAALNRPDQRPRIVVEGDFGSGKSHLMRAAVHDRPGVIWFELSGFGERTTWVGPNGLHAALLTVPLERLMGDIGHVTSAELEQYFSRSPLAGISILRKALKDLLLPLDLTGAPNQAAVDARAWLTASRTLAPAAALRAGYGQLSTEVLMPAHHAQLLDLLAEMAADRTGVKPLLVIDEGNAFANLKSSATLSALGEWTRALVDPDRRALGLLLGLVTPSAYGRRAHPLLRSDVRSRIPELLRLEPLGDSDHARQFLDKLWEKVSTLRAVRPFRLDNDALAWLHQNLPRLRLAYPGDMSESLAADPSRRDLLRLLQIVGEQAAATETALITKTLVIEWLGER